MADALSALLTLLCVPSSSEALLAVWVNFNVGQANEVGALSGDASSSQASASQDATGMLFNILNLCYLLDGLGEGS